MTDVLFIIAMVVAALGIPGVLPWLQAKARPKPIAARINPRSLVPPSSPSGVVSPGPNYKLPPPLPPELMPPRPRPLGNQSLSAIWANVNAARAAALGFDDLAAALDRDSPPAPPPRPRLD